MVTKMAVAKKMENKLNASGVKKKKKEKKTEKRKKGKGNTRSAGLVKFRGTAGPYKVSEKSVKIENIKRERGIGKIGKESEAK